MYPRLRPVDASAGRYFLAAGGTIVVLAQIGLDRDDRPLFQGGCRIYNTDGNVVRGPSGDDGTLADDDLVADLDRDHGLVISTEVSLAFARAVAEEHVHAQVMFMDVCEAVTRERLVQIIDDLLIERPMFQRFRSMLITSNLIWL